MGIAGDGDDALPSLALAGVVENRHACRRLHNLEEEARIAAKIRQSGGHTPLPEAAILRTVSSIDNAASGPEPAGRADCQVIGRRLRSSRRWRPIFPALAAGQVVLAQVCGLHEGQLKISYGVPFLLSLRRKRRNPPVGRIHNQRRPATQGFVRREDRRVVRAADVLFAPPLAAALISFSTDSGRSQLIQFGSFLIRKNSLLAYFAGRCKGVSASLSRCPAGRVRPMECWVPAPAFVAPASVVAFEPWPGASLRSATTATMTTATPIINAGNRLLIGTS